MHGVVEATVTPPGQPEDLVATGGDLDGGGAVVGGEAVPVGKAAHVNDVADPRSPDAHGSSPYGSEAASKT